MEERKLGEIITFDGKQFQVVEGDCEDCYFNDKDCTSSHYDDLGICESLLRKDECEICYKLIK